MTAPQGGTGKAYTFEAGGKKEVAPMPFMQDKCFLCSLGIGESDPRQFYTGPAGSTGIMMLAHTGCLQKFMANGEKWPQEAVEVKPDTVVDGRTARFGNALMTYGPHHLKLTCAEAIGEHGLKKVIPDLIVALKMIEESL